MSVRPTQTKSGYPRRSRQPYPTGEQGPVDAESSDRVPVPVQDQPAAGLPDETGADGPVTPDPASTAPAPDLEAASRVASRKSQRAVRRTRRNVAIVCAVVVALCLILTILIVNMARIRTSGPQVVVSSVAASMGAPGPVLLSTDTPNQPILDALAPEGGNP